MELNKGDEAIYIEINDGIGGKRYVLPKDASYEAKLRHLLTDYPKISFVRSGPATLTSEPDRSELDAILEVDGLPAKVDALFRAHMPTHPDTVDNFVRYSQELIDLVKEREVSDVQLLPSQQPPAESLTDKLRNQVEGSSSQGHQMSLPTSSTNADSLTASLRKQVNAGVKSTPTIVDRRPAPSSIAAPSSVVEEEVIDDDHESYVEKLLEEVYERVNDGVRATMDLHAKVDALALTMNAPAQGEEITGEKLSKWFAEAAASVGFDKAFEVLAKRITGVPEA